MSDKPTAEALLRDAAWLLTADKLLAPADDVPHLAEALAAWRKSNREWFAAYSEWKTSADT